MITRSTFFTRGLFATALLLFSCFFIACEKEAPVSSTETNIPSSEDFDNPNYGNDIVFNRSNKVVTLAPLSGPIGQELTNFNTPQYDRSDLTVAPAPETGYLYVTAEQLLDATYDFGQVMEYAMEHSIAIIIESATGNQQTFLEFAEGTIVEGEEKDKAMEAIIIQNHRHPSNSRGNFSQYNPVGAPYGLQVQDVVPTFFAEYKAVDVKGPVAATERAYTNITKQEAIDRLPSGFRFSGGENNTNRRMHIDHYGSQDDRLIIQGNLHDATGTCQMQQTASLSRSLSYSKSWGVSLKLGTKSEKAIQHLGIPLLKELSFDAGWSMGRSRTEGTTNGTSLRMSKQYARGQVKELHRFHRGFYTGSYYFTARYCRGRCTGRTMRVTINYVNNSSRVSWEAWQPIMDERFTWNTWGNTLPGC